MSGSEEGKGDDQPEGSEGGDSEEDGEGEEEEEEPEKPKVTREDVSVMPSLCPVMISTMQAHHFISVPPHIRSDPAAIFAFEHGYHDCNSTRTLLQNHGSAAFVLSCIQADHLTPK